MIEVEAHSLLREFLRSQGDASTWPHYLTMARLVARALRLGKSSLIQTGVPLGDAHSRYRLSYLAPALMWQEPVILVVPDSLQQQLLLEIPQLQQWIPKSKHIHTGDRWPNHDFQGLLITSPNSWLADRIHQQDHFPNGIPTIIDCADDLETWACDQLTVSLQPQDWDELMLVRADQADNIRDARVQLTKSIFQHPENPYQCYLIAETEKEILLRLYTSLGYSEIQENTQAKIPATWQDFWQKWQTDEQMMWTSIARSQGQFSLYCGPVEVATALREIWLQQPVVLIGAVLDRAAEAPLYRSQLGLADLTCIKFSPDRNSELIKLYIPDALPMPNTPQFQEALIQHSRNLLNLETSFLSQDFQSIKSQLSPNNPQSNAKRVATAQIQNPLAKRRVSEAALKELALSKIPSPIVILIGDTPMKAQVGTVLAAEFGSRVQVEKTKIEPNSILVSGWEFWQRHQQSLPAPNLLIIATLPIPSLEDPLVAGRVTYYKESRKDWFRLYLLPAALRELQRAIAPVRESQGMVALLDNRVNHRSYGKEVLTVLSPFARINYLDVNWLSAE